MNDKQRIQLMILELQAALAEIEYREEYEKKAKEYKERKADVSDRQYWSSYRWHSNARFPKRAIVVNSLKNVGRMAFITAKEIGGIW